MSDKIDQGDVAIMLGSFNEFDEIDYRIRDCATKGVVCVVYFYEDKLSEIDQITAYNPEEGIEQALAERREARLTLEEHLDKATDKEIEQEREEAIRGA